MKKIILCICFLSAFLNVKPCGGITTQVYAGDISYSINPANPFECNVTVTLLFDIPDNLTTDSIWMDWGDGSGSPIFATNIISDSLPYSINGKVTLYKHIYQGVHVYDSIPSNGFYTISPIYQYRLSGTNNIFNGTSVTIRYYIEARVVIDTVVNFNNSSPVLSTPQVGFGVCNQPFALNSQFQNADGDSVVVNQVAPLVDAITEVPLYKFPDQYCTDNGLSGTYAVDSQSGKINWNTPCIQGIFSVARCFSKYRNGRFLGSVMSDQNIYIASAPESVAEIETEKFQVSPNPLTNMLSFNFQKNPNTEFQVAIFSSCGLLMKTFSFQQISNPIDVSFLSSGFYFVRVNSNRAMWNGSFVKQ